MSDFDVVSPYLTQDQVDFFGENGYLVIEKFWDTETVTRLRSTIGKIVSEADLDSVKSIFSTKEQVRKSDDYFLNSGPEIRFFWEEKAQDSNGDFVRPKDECINKVGHALHDLDPDFQSVSYDPRVASMCRSLGMVKPLCVQSMYIFKQKYIGGEVVPHQDGSFLYTEPQTCTGFWWALDDCTQENGCLWAVPGSHRLGVHRRFKRKDAPEEGTEFVPLEKETWDLTGAVPLEIPSGSLVVLHNALVHYSNENSSQNARHAYSIHVVDGRDGVVYPADNWLQRPAEFPFRVIGSA